MTRKPFSLYSLLPRRATRWRAYQLRQKLAALEKVQDELVTGITTDIISDYSHTNTYFLHLVNALNDSHDEMARVQAKLAKLKPLLC